MSDTVRYDHDGVVATITIDDGKANALSPQVFVDLNAALDRAVDDDAAVLLVGRDGRFSGGFDLGVLLGGGPEGRKLLRTGFELSHRLLSFPTPVVVACTGHAYAMGLFLMLSTDLRIGVAGADHRITANEVAIGLTMPHAAIEICRQRLTRAHFDRAVILAEVFNPEQALAAGILDELVPADDLLTHAHARANALGGLDRRAHSLTKLRARAAALDAIAAATEQDDQELAAWG